MYQLIRTCSGTIVVVHYTRMSILVSTSMKTVRPCKQVGFPNFLAVIATGMLLWLHLLWCSIEL